MHYTPDSPYGPYWAVSKYRDIVQVEVNHKVFSSSDEVGSIMINDAPKGMERTSFDFAWTHLNTTTSAARSARR